MRDFVVGIDIGGTNIRIGCISRDYSLSNLDIFSSNSIYSKNEPLSELSQCIKSYIDSHGIPCAICIGFPATVNKERTRIISAPNLKGLDGLNVKEYLEQQLSLPVYIEKDVNLLLLNDMRALAINDADCVAGFYIGTGIGNAIYINGEILTGKNGVSGELGHIPLFQDGICGCGNSGCAESHASGNALQKLRKEHFPFTDISNLFCEHIDTFELDQFIRSIARTIATEINILDPDCAILGGGVVNMKDFPRDVLNKYIKMYTRKPLPCDTIQICYSPTAQESGVIGAGIYAYKQIDKAVKK